MTPSEKRMRTEAQAYAALYVGVTKGFAGKCIRGERDSATAEQVVKIYRQKFAQLKQAAEAPMPTRPSPIDIAIKRQAPKRTSKEVAAIIRQKMDS